MNSFLSILIYFVLVTNVILGVVILSRGIKNTLNILFGMLTFSVSFWCISVIGFYSPNFPLETKWTAWTHLFALLISYIFFFFSTRFPSKMRIRKLIYFIAFILFFVVVYLLFYSNIIVGNTIDFKYEVNFGYYIYALIISFFFLSGYYTFALQYRNQSEHVKKNQIKYIFLGSFLSSIPAIITNLLLPAIGIFNYTWLGPIFTVFLVGSIFIAIFRFHLFNIKVIITEIISIFIISVLTIEMFLAQSVISLLTKTFVLMLFTVLSYFLIRSVYKEVEAKEENFKLAANLSKANAKLRALDRQKSEFLSIASHQIRGPLASIKGYASLILEGSFGKINPKAREAVERIFSSSHNLVLVVNDFLDVSRIDQDNMKLTPVLLDWRKVAKETIDELQPSVEKRGLKIKFSTDKKVSYPIYADIGKVKQIISNLVDNAVKYTPKGSIAVFLEKKKDVFRLTISDTGIGMSEETISVLFEKFSRAKDAGKVNIMGTGLGLYVVKKLAIMQKGKVWAESDGEGKGSRFIVEFPIHTEKSAT